MPPLKISARNQFCRAVAAVTPGTVTALNTGPIQAGAKITPPAGEETHATITNNACDALGLADGIAATALIKAPLVVLGVPI